MRPGSLESEAQWGGEPESPGGTGGLGLSFGLSGIDSPSRGRQMWVLFVQTQSAGPRAVEPTLCQTQRGLGASQESWQASVFTPERNAPGFL